MVRHPQQHRQVVDTSVGWNGPRLLHVSGHARASRLRRRWQDRRWRVAGAFWRLVRDQQQQRRIVEPAVGDLRGQARAWEVTSVTRKGGRGERPSGRLVLWLDPGRGPRRWTSLDDSRPTGRRLLLSPKR